MPGILGKFDVPPPSPVAIIKCGTDLNFRMEPSGRWTSMSQPISVLDPEGRADITVLDVQTLSSRIWAYDSSQSPSFKAGVKTGHVGGKLNIRSAMRF